VSKGFKHKLELEAEDYEIFGFTSWKTRALIEKNKNGFKLKFDEAPQKDGTLYLKIQS